MWSGVQIPAGSLLSPLKFEHHRNQRFLEITHWLAINPRGHHFSISLEVMNAQKTYIAQDTPSRSVHIEKKNKDDTVNIVLDSISQKRQTLVFCSSKKAAESQAEKIAKANQSLFPQHKDLAEELLRVLVNPTKQCKRLASCIQRGIAFHHAGLVSKQRELIENAFRKGTLHAICSTPTLAAGLDLPAFRAIIRDTKRFGARGMAPIPVLEYLQMAGRAGRPGQETHGEALLLTKATENKDYLERTYINGEVEDIFSKLAVEPVLRTYVLSLIASELITSTEALYAFFDKTFYAHQFGDTTKLHFTLDRMIRLLQDWDMLEGEEKPSSMFSTASDLAKKMSDLKATKLGSRVSELYLDPLTAHQIITGFAVLKDMEEPQVAILHALSCTLEMRPLIRARAKDKESIQLFLEEEVLAVDEYDHYTNSQDDYENTVRTTQFLRAWINEWLEEDILNDFNVRPGEITAKTQRTLWLLHASEELARLTKHHFLRKHFSKLQIRVQHGVKSELLPLLQFKQVGRVRARKLFNAGLVSTKKLQEADVETLVELVGPKLAKDLKAQVGQDVEVEQKAKTSSSQATLGNF